MWQQKCSHPHPHLSHNDVPVTCTPKMPRQKAACGGRELGHKIKKIKKKLTGKKKKIECRGIVKKKNKVKLKK